MSVGTVGKRVSMLRASVREQELLEELNEVISTRSAPIAEEASQYENSDEAPIALPVKAQDRH
jgi:hypothetical protein